MWTFAKKPPKKTYRFSYSIGLKNGDTQSFSSEPSTSEEVAKAKRAAVFQSMTAAITDGVLLVDDNLVVRGEDISWFIVQEVEEK